MRGDIEDTKATLASWLLSSRFTDKLTAVNVEKNDGYSTDAPAKVYPHPRAELEAYPAAQLLGFNTVYDLDDEAKTATHRIGVQWTVVGDREDHVTSDVERLMRATRELFWRSSLGGEVNAAPILIESEDYSELLPGSAGQPLAKAGMTTLLVTTIMP